MAGKRSYRDACGTARALDVVGDRWALLVVRELLLGPKRFTDLRGGLPEVSADVLAQRLRDLELAGLLTQRTLLPPAASRVYELTGRGRELEPVVLALGRWGSTAPFAAGVEPALSNDAMILALKGLFDPDRNDRREASDFELVLGGDRYRLRVGPGGFEAARGEAEDPVATIEAESTAPLVTVLWHGRRLSRARRSGDLRIDGDAAAAKAFLELFPLPAPSS